MNTQDNTVLPTAEELAAEQADSVIPEEAQVREQIIEVTGFDPESEDDKPKIQKLVEREMDGRKKLSSTIGAKIKFRDQATKGKPEKKETKPADNTTATAEPQLSTADLYALMDGKVHQDDVPEVQKSAKLLGKSIADTLKDPIVIGVLKRNTDFRATAKAANTNGGRGKTKEISDQEILDRASKGEAFAKGSPEAEQLFHARRARGARRR